MAAQGVELSIPIPSYVASEGSVFHANRAFYTHIAETTAHELVEDFIHLFLPLNVILIELR